MQCERCKKNAATVHIIRLVNGERQDHHYCESCAASQENIDFNSPLGANSFLTSLIESIQGTAAKTDYGAAVSCPKCGMSYSRFKQTGRLGCEECYRTFSDKLRPLIKRVQSSDHHTGKVLRRSSGLWLLKQEIENLKERLQLAVAQEAYEEAATLRDQIRALEQQAQAEGGTPE